MFLKISQCSQKTPVACIFIKHQALKACMLIKKEIPTQVFSCECCKIFKNSFLVEHFLFIILLRDDRIIWTSLGSKLAFHISCTIALFSFISGVHSYFLLVFIPKFLVSVTSFARISTSAPALF